VKLIRPLLAVSTLLCVMVATSAAAQDAVTGFPRKPIKMVVPFAAGGPTDVIARAIAVRMNGMVGQPVIVENRPGAGGNIAIQAVAKSPADGYTLLFSSSNIVSNPALYKDAFNPVKDFVPITYAAVAPNIIYVHPSVPASNVNELVALMKQKPGQFSFGTPGVGTTPHIACEALRLAAGVDMVHVPYQGAAPVVNAVLGNQVPIGCSALPPTTPHINAGRLKAIAVTSQNRSAIMPNVPTLAESGFPDVIADNLQGVLAPAGTPEPIVSMLNKVIVQILSEPETKQRLTAMGFDVYGTTSLEFGKIINQELDRYTQIIKRSGIKLE
jgi:tripartite-type tricarboxylate transporter receptor subunit TctC